MALVNETELAKRTDESVARPAWISGLTGGLAGGVVMGILVALLIPSALVEYVPDLRTPDGLLAASVVHLAVAAVYGIGYAALVTETGLVEKASSFTWNVGIGLTYGAVIWLAAMAIVLPLWFGELGTTSLPWLDPRPFVGHLVYGSVLGIVFRVLEFE